MGLRGGQCLERRCGLSKVWVWKEIVPQQRLPEVIPIQQPSCSPPRDQRTNCHKKPMTFVSRPRLGISYNTYYKFSDDVFRHILIIPKRRRRDFMTRQLVWRPRLGGGEWAPCFLLHQSRWLSRVQLLNVDLCNSVFIQMYRPTTLPTSEALNVERQSFLSHGHQLCTASRFYSFSANQPTSSKGSGNVGAQR